MRSLKFLSVFTLLSILFFAIIAFKSDSNEKALATKNSEQAIADANLMGEYEAKREKLHAAVQQYFELAIATGDIVGAGVSIVKGDAILISAGFGKRSVEGMAEVNGKTIFRLGSLSKGFTGVLTADLQREGKLDWNDKITDYIPEFQFGDKTNTAKVKLAHILSHTSGTPYHSYTNLVEAGLPMSTIATRFNEVNPISEPGAMYSYQNAMFALSQEVILKVTGQDINSLLNSRFIKPLGMSTTSMDHSTLTAAENVAMPHSRRGKGWRSLALKNRYYNAVAAGGINASALDMAKWMRFLLGHNPEVMPKAAIAKAFTPFIELNDNNKYYQRWPGHIKSFYGFGWRIHTFQGPAANKEIRVWHHGGSVNNYRNEIAVLPDADLGICVLLNGNSKIAKTVIPDLYKIIENNYK